MQIENLSWKQVEDLVKNGAVAVLPLGSTEQHSGLSLATDTRLASKLAEDAVGDSNSVIFPALAYGLVPQFKHFAGTISIKSTTYLLLIREILESILSQGFNRIFVINGHGGNIPAKPTIYEALENYPEALIQWHDWWIAPKTWAKVMEIDPIASHASWMENFPWTRIEGSAVQNEQKPMVDLQKLRQLSALKAKEFLEGGNFGGRYQRSDEEMMAIWASAISETRELFENGWAR